MVYFTDHCNAISIDRISSKTKIGIDSWKTFTKIILLCKPQLQRLLFLLKTQKTATLQQVTGGDTPNIVLKRMPRYFTENSTPQDLVLKRMLEVFLTVLPLKKILQFQESILFFFFLKNTKQQSLKEVSDGETANLVLKRMLELFLKVPPLKKLEFQNKKKDYEICTKRKFGTKN